ncbi:hypothetical protein CDL15_Pgr004488 [Punica granatum]|uniref:Uncharacterized protein n=1 Tax=Punica granatum TaxID=22663 RepID=A0A218WDT1_PUNGR|nr:hypothetical protein CDL15_Pgr004488 [Punica granatum]
MRESARVVLIRKDKKQTAEARKNLPLMKLCSSLLVFEILKHELTDRRGEELYYIALGERELVRDESEGGGALEGEGVAEGEGGEEGGQEGGEEERVRGGGEGGELGADELPPAEKGAGGQGGEEERRRKRESMRLMESNSISRNATKGDSGDVGGSCIAKRVDGRGMHCRLSQ